MLNETIQLWRGEGLPPENPAKLADWITQSQEYQNTVVATGRWFTDKVKDALWYIENIHGGKGVLRSITLHRDVALVFRVDQFDGRSKNQVDSPRAFSKKPESEYFLPAIVAARAVETPRPEVLPSVPHLSPQAEISAGSGLIQAQKSGR
jgi:hypothetical protein